MQLIKSFLTAYRRLYFKICCTFAVTANFPSFIKTIYGLNTFYLENEFNTTSFAGSYLSRYWRQKTDFSYYLYFQYFFTNLIFSWSINVYGNVKYPSLRPPSKPSGSPRPSGGRWRALLLKWLWKWFWFQNIKNYNANNDDRSKKHKVKEFFFSTLG